MSQSPKPKSPPPPELELLRRFVNTLDVESGEDALGAPDALAAWLREAGLPVEAPSEEECRRVRAVREALRALLLANNGHELDVAALAVLQQAAERATLTVRFGAGGDAALRPSCSGADAAVGVLLAIVAHSQADGTWKRLKACAADPCRWAFYDHSRNRSRHWCSMEVCGNRAKARSYRRRAAGEADERDDAR